MNIQNLGLQFKGPGNQGAVEGYMQLLNATKQNEQLKNEVAKMHKHIQDMDKVHEETLNELKY